MRFVLYGATGRAESRIIQELVNRGHRIRAVTRELSHLELRGNVEVSVDDLSDVCRTIEIIRGFDAVISAYAPPASDTDRLVALTELLVEAVGRSRVARLLMVGGAGSLKLPTGSR